MSKIALVGAPGAGKTKFAKTLGLAVYDRVPQRFSKRTGLMVGKDATWYVNTMLASARLQQEYENRANDFVSTTTVLDSLAYACLAMYIYEEVDPERLTLDDVNKPYYFTSLYLARLVDEAWNYDKVFYLPRTRAAGWFVTLDSIYRNILEEKGIAFETVD